MTRVLVLGGMGMLGHMVVKVLRSDPCLVVDATQHRSEHQALWLDAEFPRERLREFFLGMAPYAFAVNCIGLTKPGIDERDPRTVERAIRLNALFPHELASVAAETGSRVVHISTDGVFKGDADAYLEDAAHDSLDVYGKTKSLGEVVTPQVLTLRCSIIGPDPAGKRGLVEWFRGQPESAKLSGYTDHLWNGVTTPQFARLCHAIITQNRFDAIREEGPAHHFCPNRPISKYRLLEILKDAYKKDVTITPSPGPGAPVRRILKTRYRRIEELVGSDLRLEDELQELVHW